MAANLKYAQKPHLSAFITKSSDHSTTLVCRLFCFFLTLLTNNCAGIGNNKIQKTRNAISPLDPRESSHRKLKRPLGMTNQSQNGVRYPSRAGQPSLQTPSCTNTFLSMETDPVVIILCPFQSRAGVRCFATGASPVRQGKPPLHETACPSTQHTHATHTRRNTSARGLQGEMMSDQRRLQW